MPARRPTCSQTAYLEVLGPDVVVHPGARRLSTSPHRGLSQQRSRTAAGSGCDVVLDLEAATFVDVYCLRLVLLTQEVVANRGHTVVVVNAPPVFQRLVDVLEIPDLIAVMTAAPAVAGCTAFDVGQGRPN